MIEDGKAFIKELESEFYSEILIKASGALVEYLYFEYYLFRGVDEPLIDIAFFLGDKIDGELLLYPDELYIFLFDIIIEYVYR